MVEHKGIHKDTAEFPVLMEEGIGGGRLYISIAETRMKDEGRPCVWAQL